MDFPETSKTTTDTTATITITTTAVAAAASSDPPAAHGSPPSVFRSPHINPNSAARVLSKSLQMEFEKKKSIILRSHFPQLSTAEIPLNDDRGKKVAADLASKQHCGGNFKCRLFEGNHLNTIADIPRTSNLSNSSELPATLSNSQAVCSHNAGRSPVTVSKPSELDLILNSVLNKNFGHIDGLDIYKHHNQPSPKKQRKNALSPIDDKSSKGCKCWRKCLKLYCECFAAGKYCSEFCECKKCIYYTPEYEDLSPIYDKSCKGCKCKRGKCLKLYCECFADEKYCSEPCECEECYNTPEYEDWTPIFDKSSKRCKCKRSKCLKLYCECFAAGKYCSEPCKCRECCNTPEYEDLVNGRREEIEFRDPLAFEPKVVKPETFHELQANSVEDANRLSLSSARHQRGCNCMKSMCLKKYCICYEAKVGCSYECRCEGCKNEYGRKEEVSANMN